MGQGDSRAEGWEYILDLHRQKIGYENGYWVTIRAAEVAPDDGRPHGLQYSLTLHDENDDRILGYDNSHPIEVSTGPGGRCRRPKAFDHVDRRGRRSVPYEFTTPYKLVEDFFAEVDKILREESGS